MKIDWTKPIENDLGPCEYMGSYLSSTGKVHLVKSKSFDTFETILYIYDHFSYEDLKSILSYNMIPRNSIKKDTFWCLVDSKGFTSRYSDFNLAKDDARKFKNPIFKMVQFYDGNRVVDISVEKVLNYE